MVKQGGVAMANPKYDLIISLANAGFTPKDVSELSLSSITKQSAIVHKDKILKMTQTDIDNLAAYVSRFASLLSSVDYLFPSKNRGQSKPDRLTMIAKNALKLQGKTLADIGWARETVHKPKTTLKTLEDILAFAKRVKEKGTTN